jgi:hypothetical protein
MIDLYRSCKCALAVGALLMLGPSAGAQVARPAPRVDPKIYTQPQPAQKPPVREIEDQNRYRDAMFAADPCSIITRSELEAILKRGDTDRALVTMPKQPSWQSDGKKVGCSYSVSYENRIFPEQVSDNSVVIAVDFEDRYAKQGKLIVDRPVVYGSQMELEIVNGLGDEAVFLRDVSRLKQDERYKSTAGAQPYQYYDNQDVLVVRKRTLVFTFKITSTVGGNTGSANQIQIARTALARVR